MCMLSPEYKACTVLGSTGLQSYTDWLHLTIISKVSSSESQIWPRDLVPAAEWRNACRRITNTSFRTSITVIHVQCQQQTNRQYRIFNVGKLMLMVWTVMVSQPSAERVMHLWDSDDVTTRRCGVSDSLVSIVDVSHLYDLWVIINWYSPDTVPVVDVQLMVIVAGYNVTSLNVLNA